MGVAVPGPCTTEHEASCVNCGGPLHRTDGQSMWWHDNGVLECPPVGTWWGVAEAASHCGIRPGTWRDYVARGHAPQPDNPDECAPKQRRRPRWRAETVRAWHAARPGKGGRPKARVLADAAPGARDTDLDFGHIHDWILDRSDYEPCVCGAVMPEPPF